MNLFTILTKIIVLVVISCGKPVSRPGEAKGDDFPEESLTPPESLKSHCSAQRITYHSKMMESHSKSMDIAARVSSNFKQARKNTTDLDQFIQSYENFYTQYNILKNTCIDLNTDLFDNTDNIVCSYIQNDKKHVLVKRKSRHTKSLSIDHYCNKDIALTADKIAKYHAELLRKHPSNKDLSELPLIKKIPITPRTEDNEICKATLKNLKAIHRLSTETNDLNNRLITLKKTLDKDSSDLESQSEFVQEFYYLYSETGLLKSLEGSCEYKSAYDDINLNTCLHKSLIEDFREKTQKSCDLYPIKKVKNNLITTYNLHSKGSISSSEKILPEDLSKKEEEINCVKSINKDLSRLTRKRNDLHRLYKKTTQLNSKCQNESEHQVCLDIIDIYHTDFSTLYNSLDSKCDTIQTTHSTCIDKGHVNHENIEEHCKISSFNSYFYSYKNKAFTITDLSLETYKEAINKQRVELESLRAEISFTKDAELKKKFIEKAEYFSQDIHMFTSICEQKWSISLRKEHKRTSQVLCDEYTDKMNIDDLLLIKTY